MRFLFSDGSGNRLLNILDRAKEIDPEAYETHEVVSVKYKQWGADWDTRRQTAWDTAAKEINAGMKDESQSTGERQQLKQEEHD